MGKKMKEEMVKAGRWKYWWVGQRSKHVFVSDQDLNNSNGATTPSGGGKLGAFSLNAFDLASLQTCLREWSVHGYRQGYQQIREKEEVCYDT